MFTSKRNAQSFDSLNSILSIDDKETILPTNEYDIHYEFYNDYNNYESSIIETKSESTITSKCIKCEICNKDDSDKNFIILSCCNNIVHIKCIVSELQNDFSDGLHEKDKSECFENIECIKCHYNMHYSDIFSIYYKTINANKNIYEKVIAQKQELQEQMKKIENELKCINEYIDKIEREKKMAQTIISKTFLLLSDGI